MAVLIRRSVFVTFFPRVWSALYRLIGYGSVVGLVVLAILMKLEYLHEHPAFLLFIALAMLVLLELVVHSQTTVEHLVVAVNALQRASVSTLSSLEAAVADLHDRLGTSAAAAGRIAIRLDHLGLDMTHAWDELKRVLESPVLHHVEIRLLMLSKTLADGGTRIPGEVARWCRESEDSFEAIQKWAAAAPGQLTGRAVKFSVKRYAELPVVHGVRVSGPLSMRYIAFCRWSLGPPEIYEWGQRAYHVIPGEAVDGRTKDVAEIFDRYFEHLWRTSGAPVLDMQSDDAGTAVTRPRPSP